MAFVDYGSLLVPESYAERQAQLEEVSGDWRSEFDSPYNRSTWNEHLGILGRYNLLREWTYRERRDVLERCHTVWERNPLANSIVAYTTQFVVGDGIQVTYKNPDVEAVLEAFMDDPDNDFYNTEKELCDGLQVDGEIFIRFFDKDEEGNSTGKTIMVPLRPWDVQYVRTDINFRKRKLGYIWSTNLHDGYQTFDYRFEEIPAADVIHIAINNMPYEVRGRPELLRILPWLKAYKDYVEEVARMIRRMSVYYHMKMHNATPGQVSAARSQYAQPPPPASILVTNDNVEMSAVSSGIRGSDFSTVGRDIKLMALAGARLPEYFFAEGQTANRASTTSQQMPALRKFAEFKEKMADLLSQVFMRVIRNAMDAGLLQDEFVPEFNTAGDPVMNDQTGQQKMVSVFYAFDGSYADLEEADPFMEAQAIQLDMANGFVSKETASVKRGYDYAVEQKKIEAEAAKQMQAAYAGTGIPQGVGTGAPQPAQTSAPQAQPQMTHTLIPVGQAGTPQLVPQEQKTNA